MDYITLSESQKAVEVKPYTLEGFAKVLFSNDLVDALNSPMLGLHKEELDEDESPMSYTCDLTGSMVELPSTYFEVSIPVLDNKGFSHSELDGLLKKGAEALKEAGYTVLSATNDTFFIYYVGVNE